GRRPGLHQIVVETDVVDRLDRYVGIGVRGEQHELGTGRRYRGTAEELDAGHLRHAVIRDDEGDGLVPAGKLLQGAQRGGARHGADEAVAIAVARSEVSSDRLRDR